MLSKFTVVAAGGCGNIYSTTTNPVVATGDGIAMCHRAKAITENMEFIQFHPTSLYNPAEKPNFLITEAMRGYGAILRLPDGEEFMDKYHPMKSLAPRDVTARAIYREMTKRGSDFVYLDVTHKNPEAVKEPLPEHLREMPLDRHRHHQRPDPRDPCGALLLRRGEGRPQRRNLVKRLYALGETSCTGLHGANRLASNSLIEAVVYADQAAQTHGLAAGESRFPGRHSRLGLRRHAAHRRDADDHPVQARNAGADVQLRRHRPLESLARTRPAPAGNPLRKRPKSCTTKSSPTASCANCAT